MMKRILWVGIILALAALACGTSISLPKVPTPGPEMTEKVNVPAPGGGQVRLTISFGAGELKLTPGTSSLVEGTATYNVTALKPEVVKQDSSVEIKQSYSFDIVEPGGIKNTWDFKLGTMPMDMTVNAGAYTGDYELGGLSLTGLTIKDGASTVDLSFAEPNRSEMAVLRYETGASKISVKGLANANFNTMIFNSGAGDYTLDFSGTLKRNAIVTISTGLSNLILVVPEGVPATMTMEGGVVNVNAASSWTKTGNIYSQSGSGSALTFIVKAGAGNISLTH